MVIGSHAFTANAEAGGVLTRRISACLGYGFFGVDLFFVLSGFLITGILVDSLDEDGFFRKFYARRVLRIFPLYYGVLLVLFLLTPVLRLQWHGMGWLMLGYFQNVRPNEIGTFSPGAGVALNHFWSLAVEEQFYLFWPAMVFFIRDRRRLLITTIAISAGALIFRLILIRMGVGAETIHVTTITRADSLLLGGAFSLFYRSSYWPTLLKVAPYGFLVAAAIVLISILRSGNEFGPVFRSSLAMRFWIDGLRYTILALGSACLLAWSLRPDSVCGWFFELRLLRFFGKYSYGIYVLHMIPLPFLLQTQRAALFQVAHNKLLAVAGAGFSTLLLAVGAAYLSFHYYEKPFLRMKRFFDYGSGRDTSKTPGGLSRSDLVNS